MGKYQKGKIVQGVVTGIETYGAFVAFDEFYSGLIHISEINCDFLNFEITLYDTKGTYIAKNNYQLNINEKIDINNDTIADLEYKKTKYKSNSF